METAEYHNPQVQTGGGPNKHTWAFGYDGLNRLKEADFEADDIGPFDVAGLNYDKAGNIEYLKRRDENGSLLDDLQYFYTGNRLDSLADNSGVSLGWDAKSVDAFGYDANGNLTSQSGKIDAIEYDHRNLPVRFALASGDTVIAGYNAAGQRILKELKGQAWTFYVMDGQQTLAVLEQDTLTHMNLVANTTFGRIEANNGAMSLSNARRYYLKDVLGSTRAVVDETGTITETRDYYPFGGLMPERQYQQGEGTPEKFTGHELDDQTGWYYAGARYMDPMLGRWLSPDPLASKYPSLSPYNYVANNPVNAFDPDGKRIFFVGGAGNDQDGWNYINRFRRAFTNAGIQGFTRVNATFGQPRDVDFTLGNRHSSSELRYSAGLPAHYTRAVQDPRIDKTVNQIRQNLADNPLAKGEQLNLAGYSSGSVLQAQAALKLAGNGTKIDNLILIGSPISTDSDLFQELSNSENIKNVIRIDIEGDPFSNPEGFDILKGVFNVLFRDGDNHPHFDFARPGQETDKRLDELAKELRDKGVQ